MRKPSETKYWDQFWSSSRNLQDVYSTDGRVIENLQKHVNFAGLKVLEVGAGTGRDSVLIASRGAKVYALDNSQEALNLMRTSLEKSIDIVCGDALDLPFADESFDIVFHQGLLEHFKHPSKLLDENRRVLRKGGILLVDVPQRFHYYTLLKHGLMLIGKWFAGWETEFTPGQLRALIEDRGFEVMGMYGENLYPPVWYRAMRRVLLNFWLRLPMHPKKPTLITKVGNFFRSKLPEELFLKTVMVVGCVARKA